MLTYIIAFVIFPLSILIGIRKYSEGTFEKEYFNKGQTTTLKGIMIMFVFFHHFSHVVTDTYWIEYVTRIAHPCITIFFMIAGYTTYLGHAKIETLDLKKLWINRSWRLYLPLLIFTVPFNNFLTPLLVFFIFSDVAFMVTRNTNYRLAIIAFGNVFYYVVCLAQGVAEFWYDDVLTFAVGAIFAAYKDQIIQFFQDKVKYYISLIVFIIICIPTGYLGLQYKYYDIVITIFSFFGCLIIVLLLMKFNIKSKLYYFLGGYTWEIFMTHQMFMELYKRFTSRNSIILVLSFVSSVALSYLIQNGVKALRKKVTKTN